MWSLQNLKSDLKYGLIRAGLEVAASPLAQHILPNAGGRGVIFTLHHVRPNNLMSESPNDILSITPEFLEDAISAAVESGLTPVHLHDLPRLFSDPTDKRRFVAFTLDDGYRNNAQYAAPVFQKYHVPYTIFINPGFVERTRTIWWETAASLTQKVSAFEFDFGNGTERVRCSTKSEKFSAFDRLAVFVRTIDEDIALEKIDEVARFNGIDPVAIVHDLVMSEAELKSLAYDPLVHFGAHTVSHVNLRRVSAQRLEREITESISRVGNYTGQPPRSFSYPYGWSTAVGDREAIAVADAGMPVAVTTQPGVLTSASFTRPTQLPRISLNGYYQKKRYVKALISGIPFKMMGAV